MWRSIKKFVGFDKIARIRELDREFYNPTKIAIGLSKSDVRTAWGEPDSGSTSISSNSSIEHWTYIVKRNKAYLSFENDKLIKIDIERKSTSEKWEEFMNELTEGTNELDKAANKMKKTLRD